MTEAKRAIRFRYTNHKGQEATRTVRPLRVSEEEYPWDDNRTHWVMYAHDMDRGETRTFVLAWMRDIEEVEL